MPSQPSSTACRSGPETACSSLARIASRSPLSYSPAAGCDAWAIVANPRLSPRELDQIHVHSGARRIFLTTGISKEAADHAARLQAVCREIGPFSAIGIGALNETAEPEPVENDTSRQNRRADVHLGHHRPAQG